MLTTVKKESFREELQKFAWRSDQRLLLYGAEARYHGNNEILFIKRHHMNWSADLAKKDVKMIMEQSKTNKRVMQSFGGYPIFEYYDVDNHDEQDYDYD